MSFETHIAGILVHGLADRAAELARTIDAWPQAEVCGVSEAGKLVVVSECADGDAMVDLMARMRELPGVLSVALVYQHTEPAGVLDEEIDDEADAPRVH